MGYVIAAWIVAGVFLVGYGGSIALRRRALAAEVAAERSAAAAERASGPDGG